MAQSAIGGLHRKIDKIGRKLDEHIKQFPELKEQSDSIHSHLKYIQDDINKKNAEAKESKEKEERKKKAKAVADGIDLVGKIYDNLDDLRSDDVWIQLGTAYSLIGAAAAMFGGPVGLIAGSVISLVSRIAITERKKALNKGQFSEIKKAFKEHEHLNVEIEVETFKRDWYAHMNTLNTKQSELDNGSDEKTIHELDQWIMEKISDFGDKTLASLATNINENIETTDKEERDTLVYYIWTYCLLQCQKRMLQNRVISVLQKYKKDEPDYHTIFKKQSVHETLFESDKERFHFVVLWPRELLKENQEKLFLLYNMHEKLRPSQIKLMNAYLSEISDGKFKIHGQIGSLIQFHFDWSAKNDSWPKLCWRITRDPTWKLSGNCPPCNLVIPSTAVDVGGGAGGASPIGAFVGGIIGSIGGPAGIAAGVGIGGVVGGGIGAGIGFFALSMQNIYINPDTNISSDQHFFLFPSENKKGQITNEEEIQLLAFNDPTWIKFYGWNDGWTYGTDTFNNEYDEYAKWKIIKRDKDEIYQLQNTKNEKIKFTFWDLQDKARFFEKILKPLRGDLDAWIEDNPKNAEEWETKWDGKNKYKSQLEYYKMFNKFDAKNEVERVEEKLDQ